MTKAAQRDGNTANFSPSVQAGGFVFVSGQASVDESGQIVPGSFAEEMDRSVSNVKRILAERNLGLSDVVRVNCYLQDTADAPEFNRLYPQYFSVPLPARTTIAGCLSDQIKFEIDVIAYSGGGPTKGG